jgi:CRP/FNR family cyclic AMP-dependent transcriptional regulator
MADDLAHDALDEQALDRAAEAVRAQAAVTRTTAERRRSESKRLVMETAQLQRRVARGRHELVFILDEDPELGAGLPEVEQEAVSALLRARTILVEDSTWTAPSVDPSTAFGLLVLDGLIGRRVSVDEAVALELIGAGDIVRPWDEEGLTSGPEWRVFQPARLAILDERITNVVGRHPELVVSFSGRVLRRVRSANELMAISHLPRVEQRVLAALWHLAAIWGRVTPAGVTVPFRLTHEVLGEIVGAARPTVTIAMRILGESGEVRRGASGEYVLGGEPPPRYAAA